MCLLNKLLESGIIDIVEVPIPLRHNKPIDFIPHVLIRWRKLAWAAMSVRVSRIVHNVSLVIPTTAYASNGIVYGEAGWTPPVGQERPRYR